MIEGQMGKPLTDRLLKALVGRPIVSNAFRGTLVEAILADALEPECRWCADGWGPFDFEGPGGIGLEVKQSAARQDWHGETSQPGRGRFDIAERTGRWEGALWIPGPGRAASIYIFAWHPFFDVEQADHRDPGQWQFHVVPASLLPAQKSIGLSRVRTWAEPVGIAGVKREILKHCEGIRGAVNGAGGS